MNRTVRMLRRTLLCAVFACPLAAWKMLPAFCFQALYTLIWVPRLPVRPLWAGASGGFSAGLGRAAFSLCMALAGGSIAWALCLRLLPLPLAPLFGALCLLTGILCQATLIWHVQRTGRRHYAACLFALALFIACMQ